MNTRNRLVGHGIVGLFIVLSLGVVLLSLPRTASASPTGTYFDHIIIVAMENQDYCSGVIVCGDSSSGFIPQLAAAGSVLSNYQAYSQGIGGCSHGCYEAFTIGVQLDGDGSCPRASMPGCGDSNPTIANQLNTAGLTSAAFCEDGCPRGSDHFPWIQYTNTWISCESASSFNCSGQPTNSGMLMYSSSSSSGNSEFINYLNSANPASYIWFTPTDSHNMHDNSVSSGDAYVKNLLVGSGSLSSPSSNSVFGSSLWKAGHTLFYLWWDENSNPPMVLYGPMIKSGFVTSETTNEYYMLHTIEANWALPAITNVVSGDAAITDIFGTGNNGGLLGAISINPTAPAVNATVTFSGSATGGTAPYTYTWSFGDGTTATGATATHTYTRAGIYSVAMNATDSTGQTNTKTQQVSVGQTSPPGLLPGFTPTVALLIIGLIVVGAAGTVIYLARYHAHNRKLRDGMV